MKTFLLSLCMFAALCTTAQKKRFYNWKWEPCDAAEARFISISRQTDSGWLRQDFFLSTQKLQTEVLYTDSTLKIKNGWFRYYYVNQVPSSCGRFVNGKKDGIWRSYFYDGTMQDSVLWENGEVRTGLAWHSNGVHRDSTVIDKDGKVSYTAWFDNGRLSYTGQGFYKEKVNEWQYFHKNGKPAATETYKYGRVVTRIYYDENGVQMADTTRRDREATFKGSKKDWDNYLLNSLRYPDGVTLKNTDRITVVVDATIDEEGNVTDAYVSVPVHPKFDEEALRVFKRSPKWNPAIAHNRYIKFYIRQPISFGQYDY